MAVCGYCMLLCMYSILRADFLKENDVFTARIVNWRQGVRGRTREDCFPVAYTSFEGV